MKKILLFVTICLATIASDIATEYNLSLGYIDLDRERDNGIATVGLGSGVSMPIIGENISVRLESGFLFLTTGELKVEDGSYYGSAEEVYSDMGFYLSGDILITSPIDILSVKPYLHSGIKGSLFIGDKIFDKAIPYLEDTMVSYKIGFGLQIQNGLFVEYSYEIYNGQKSPLSDDEKHISNSIRIGARV